MTSRQMDPRQWHHRPHDWKPRTSGWYHMPRPMNSVYLGNNKKLTTAQIGNSPKSSIPALVLPGLNVNLISCAQLCADLQCWIVLNGTGGYIYDKGGNKLCSLETLGNLFILELGLQAKSRSLVTLFSKGKINI